MASEPGATNAQRTRRRRFAAIAALALLAAFMGGYSVGRDMALRDNANAAAAR